MAILGQSNIEFKEHPGQYETHFGVCETIHPTGQFLAIQPKQEGEHKKFSNILPSNTISRPYTKRLQRLDEVLPIILAVLSRPFEEPLGLESQGVIPVILAVVRGPMLDFNKCLTRIQIISKRPVPK